MVFTFSALTTPIEVVVVFMRTLKLHTDLTSAGVCVCVQCTANRHGSLCGHSFGTPSAFCTLVCWKSGPFSAQRGGDFIFYSRLTEQYSRSLSEPLTKTHCCWLLLLNCMCLKSKWIDLKSMIQSTLKNDNIISELCVLYNGYTMAVERCTVNWLLYKSHWMNIKNDGPSGCQWF